MDIPDRKKPYDPLNRKNLGFSVAEALLVGEVMPLPPSEGFSGAGLYAIYYTGRFKHYSEISQRNKDGKYGFPIYVGKAVPSGARKGSGFDDYDGTALFNRLEEHAESIRQTSNLNLDDFKCRFLAVDDVWIPLGESLLIQRFSPLWNTVIDGFGNHDPGSGRAQQKKSPWDVLHPGRRWAEKLTGTPIELKAIEKRIDVYMHNLDSKES